jgi:hypothetical protein
VTEHARFGVRPLTRFDGDLWQCGSGACVWYRLPADPDTVRLVPGPWHVHADPGEIERFAEPCEAFGLYLPNFDGDEGRDVNMDSVSNGVVIVAAGRDSSVEAFMDYCRGMAIEDTWRHDTYSPGKHEGDRERSVSVTASDFEMRLRYDYASNTVLERSVNGVACAEPSARSSVRFVTENQI